MTLQLEILAPGLVRARLGRGAPRGLGRLRRSLRLGDRDDRTVVPLPPWVNDSMEVSATRE
jgi:hypothetical protein